MLPAGLRSDLKTWSTIRDTKTLPLLKIINTAVLSLEQAETTDAAKNADAAASGYRSSRNTSILLLVGGLVFAVGLGMLIARKIVRRSPGSNTFPLAAGPVEVADRVDDVGARVDDRAAAAGPGGFVTQVDRG